MNTRYQHYTRLYILRHLTSQLVVKRDETIMQADLHRENRSKACYYYAPDLNPWCSLSQIHHTLLSIITYYLLDLRSFCTGHHRILLVQQDHHHQLMTSSMRTASGKFQSRTDPFIIMIITNNLMFVELVPGLTKAWIWGMDPQFSTNREISRRVAEFGF